MEFFWNGTETDVAGPHECGMTRETICEFGNKSTSHVPCNLTIVLGNRWTCEGSKLLKVP